MMSEMKTTLLKIKEHGPCAGGWKKLRKNLGVKGRVTKANDREVTLLEILDSNVPMDTVWAFRCIKGFDREKRLTGCYMARCVLPIYEDKHPGDTRPRTTVETAERFAEGRATGAELSAARDAAWDAAWDAACEAACEALETYLRAMLTGQPLPEPYKFWEKGQTEATKEDEL